MENEQWDQAIDYVSTHLLDKPADFYTLDKLRRAAGVDRRLTLREILEKVFGLIPYFKAKDELLDDEFQKFLLDASTEEIDKQADKIVAIIDKQQFTALNVNSTFGMSDFRAVPSVWRDRIPEYVKDYVPLNQFMT